MSTNNTKGSRNYYGEYSLQQWIELILAKEIVLPPYQRAFVWTEEDVTDLINSLKEGLFVPPITIGNYQGNTNYILDGQQRLSAILIAYLGLFPLKDKFQFRDQDYQTTANENDDPSEGEEEEEPKPLDWQFTYFTKEGQDRESIRQKIDTNKYKALDLTLNPAFLRDTYIGFSLIIPISQEAEKQQMLYSSVFRNINIKGQRLSGLESRKSLYFLRENFDQWFSPEFARRITVNKAPIDFVRYLALLSQYKKLDNNAGRLAQNYKTKMEKYYESYILAEVNGENDSMFARLLGGDNQARYDNLEECLQLENIPNAFSSIIDADIYLFGLIYYTIVERKTIFITDELHYYINRAITDLKKDPSHTKSPSAFKHLRERVRMSIDIYRGHLQTQHNSLRQ